MNSLAKAMVGQGPVLCVDTCSVLDIMRDPTREKFDEHEAGAVVDLLGAFRSSNAHCFVARQVCREFLEHVDDVEKETENAIERYLRKLSHIHRLSLALGGIGNIEVSALHDHAARSRSLATAIIESGIHLVDDDEIFASAFKRVSQTKTPARKGKDSMKDCVVIETYLRAIRDMRLFGYSAPVVFVSSNHSDFLDPTTKKLARDLAEEFGEAGVEFAPNLSAARHILQL